MLLFFIVIGSGILGAAIQHYVPSFMTSRVPLETIYEEIPHVRAQLREEADQLAAAICGPLDSDEQRADGRAIRQRCWSKSSTTIASDSVKFIFARSGLILADPETPERRACRSAALRRNV